MGRTCCKSVTWLNLVIEICFKSFSIDTPMHISNRWVKCTYLNKLKIQNLHEWYFISSMNNGIIIVEIIKLLQATSLPMLKTIRSYQTKIPLKLYFLFLYYVNISMWANYVAHLFFEYLYSPNMRYPPYCTSIICKKNKNDGNTLSTSSNTLSTSNTSLSTSNDRNLKRYHGIHFGIWLFVNSFLGHYSIWYDVLQNVANPRREGNQQKQLLVTVKSFIQ